MKPMLEVGALAPWLAIVLLAALDAVPEHPCVSLPARAGTVACTDLIRYVRFVETGVDRHAGAELMRTIVVIGEDRQPTRESVRLDEQIAEGEAQAGVAPP